MRSSWNPDHIPAPLTQDGICAWAGDISGKRLFQVMDAQLDGLEPEKLSADILACILTATLRVKRKLPSRQRILDYVAAAKSQPGPDMLKGL